jgi:Flp pilus assembly pilin Flp
MNRKAQSILEYIIILSAIVIAVIAAARPGGVVRQAVDNMYTDTSSVITTQASTFKDQAGRMK